MGSLILTHNIKIKKYTMAVDCCIILKSSPFYDNIFLKRMNEVFYFIGALTERQKYNCSSTKT